MMTIQDEIGLAAVNIQALVDSLKGRNSSMLSFHLRGAIGRLETALDYIRGNEPSNEPYAVEEADSE